MKILPDVALTYDDVLLMPQYSDVDSRRALSTKSWLTKKIALQSPIVSANMDVVTESEMAIAMAREGGIGIIHRFMTIAEQARQIERVKKAESFIVDHPITMTDDKSVGDVKQAVEETGTGGILIVDREGRLIGIVSTRDLLFEDDVNQGGETGFAFPHRRRAQPGMDARQVGVARTYTRAVAERHVAGEFVVAEACLAKQTAVDCAAYVCDRAVQIFGGSGYMHGTEVERHYRDARLLPIGGGADEVLRDLAAKLMGYAS